MVQSNKVYLSQEDSLGFFQLGRATDKRYSLAMRRIVAAAIAAFICATAHGADLPCSIEQVRSTASGVAIRFSQKMFWNYKDSLGQYGVIGVGGVKQFVELPNGREDVLPDQAELQLKLGTSLKLHDHHSGCVIEFEGGNQRALRVTRSYSVHGKSSTDTRVVSYE